MWVKVTVSTISGAIIGYATNYLAIKMLFHPYKRKGPLHGVIPAHLEQFADNLGILARNYGVSIANSDDIALLREVAYRYTLGRLNWIQKILYGVAYFFSKGNIGNNLPDLVENMGSVLKKITKHRILDMDLVFLEMNTYKIIGRELFMLQLYGGILGGILGFITAFIMGVV